MKLDPLAEVLDRERIRRDEAALGTCRYASFCKAVAGRDDVLSTVAHDLRAPLHVILSSAELVRDLPLPEARKRQLLDGIAESVGRMNRLVQDLLDVSRLEAGRLELRRMRVQPLDLLGEVDRLFRPLADESAIELAVEAPAPLPDLDVDRDRMVQVLSNLVGNALKFTPPGGRIVLRVAPDADRGWVSFSVTDTGMGIAPAHLPHLFDRFWQAQAAPSAGAGLGLVIAKSIVEQHGGSITVESEPGRGATFRFTAPVARSTPR